MSVARSLCIPVLVAFPFLAGCQAEEPDPYSAFESFQESTVFTYTGQVPLASTGRLVAGVTGTKEIGGRTIPQWHAVLDGTGVGDLAKPELTAVDLWLGHEGGTMVVGGLDFPTLVTATVDPPVVVPLNPPVGVAQTLTFSATATIPGIATPQPVVLTAQATLVEADAVLTSPMGTFTGCNHYTAEGSLSGAGVPSLVSTGPYTADVWYHPTFGLLKANLPEMGLSVGLAAEEDYAGSEAGYGVIRRMGIVGDGQASYALSTYDRNQELDADKRTHSKMLLELRWADDAKAASSAPPNDSTELDVEFGGGFGYFPHFLVESASSYFYPGEKGFRYSYAYVSQGQKNVGGTRGTEYSIYVNQRQPGLAPVRVTARMVYKVLTPEQAAEPMPEW